MMPVIKIESLPFDDQPDLSKALLAISNEFAAKCRINQKNVSLTWSFIEIGHYVSNSQVGEFYSPASHPVLINLICADVYDSNKIVFMLETLAEVIHQQTGIPLNNMFITYQPVKSGHVFDQGKVIAWNKK